MASDKHFLEYIKEQIIDSGEITYTMMFGEYVVYSNAKIFALVCDNKLFIKPTNAGRAYIQDVVEAPPYPGAKNYFLVEEKIEDRDWLSGLVQATLAELPEPKPKKRSDAV